jgi:hypothetical protein
VERIEGPFILEYMLYIQRHKSGGDKRELLGVEKLAPPTTKGEDWSLR